MSWCHWLIYTWRDRLNEWKTEKSHECTNMRKKIESIYDGNCTSRYCLNGTYDISGRLIYVAQSVQAPKAIHATFIIKYKSRECRVSVHKTNG